MRVPFMHSDSIHSKRIGVLFARIVWHEFVNRSRIQQQY